MPSLTSPWWTRAGDRTALALALVLVGPGAAGAQLVEAPVLRGTAYTGDTAMVGGTVVLHHLTASTQGELDSLALGRDGTFAFRLPGVPDPARGDVYFASIRHHGVLYFGPAITTAIQLDSLYEVHAYDTLLAPAEGMAVPLQSRSIFLEPDSGAWRVTDLFQLRNDEARTIVARPDGRVWRYPLPREARDVVTGQGEVALDAAAFEDGALVVRAALPPGERLFVVRYRLASPFVEVPTPGTTEAFDLLIREPAPPLEVDGVPLNDRIELEAGTTYLRFTSVDWSTPTARIREGEVTRELPGSWIAVILALVFAVGGLAALRSGQPAVPAGDRRALLVAVARLDEDFAGAEATDEARRAYEKRRAELLRRIRSSR